MRFRILGPLEVADAAGARPLGGPHQRALLAALLLRPNTVVSRDRLIDDLWGERPPQSAAKIVQLYVSALRKAFDPQRRILRTEAPGYRLVLDPDELDASAFEWLAAEGRRALAAGRTQEAAAKLREALALWRGPVLADLKLEPFAYAEVARLEELRLAAIEDRIDADLAEGQSAELVPELETLVAEHPLREPLRARLMLALYRSGRQSDALEVYREARNTLVAELGLEPGPELRAVERAILVQDPELAAPTAENEEPAERRLVTAVFVELVPSEPLDAEVLARLVAAATSKAAAVLERHGATVDRRPGTLIGLFGQPRMREDDALRAARAALQVRAAVATPLDAAIGLNTGEVLTGDAAAATLRLPQRPAPGEIHVGEETAPLLGDGARLERGESGWLLREVLPDAQPIARRSETPFVGRSRELEQLSRAVERAVRGRRPARVIVLGAAGVGKSRLAAELVASLVGVAVLTGRCLAYGDGITFWPLTEIVRRRFGDDPRPGIETLLAGDPDAGAVTDRLSELGAVGADEAAWATRRLFEALARREPLLVVLDDLQWAEPSFLGLVVHVVALARDAPFLVLCLARPELADERPDWADGETIVLEPLSDDESGALIGHLAGPIDDDERSRITDAAEGNPLFIEQLLAMRAETGSADRVPTTIQVLLAARLDRLERGERALLQRASVAGKEFWSGFAGDGDHLRALVRKDMVRPAASMLPGEPGFQFRHQLIRDAAYRSLPKHVRAELHEEFVEWLEQRTAAQEFEEIAGWHLEQAARCRTELGEPDVELARRGAERLGSAGRRAFDRSDLGAARTFLSRAVELLDADDRMRIELLPLLGDILRATGDYDASSAVLADAIARGDDQIAWRARLCLLRTRLRTETGESLDELRAECEEAVRALAALGDEGGVADAWSVRVWIDFLAGRAADAAAAARRSIELARSAGEPTIERRSAQMILQLLLYGPTPAGEAVVFCDDLLAREQSLIMTATTCRALAGLRAMEGAFDEARALRDRDLAILGDLGYELMAAYAEEVYGELELLAGDAAAAEQRFRRAYDWARGAGDFGAPIFAARLAEAVYAQGRTDEALEYTDVAARSAPEEARAVQVLWRATRAKALARVGELEEAQELARAAVARAESTDFLTIRADALGALAEVSSGDEAAAARAQALALYHSKGDVAGAARLGR